MGEFFHGWLRKLGVVTLVMALAFMVGWVRSLSIDDVVSFHSSARSTEYLHSVSSVLVWQNLDWNDNWNASVFPIWHTMRVDPDEKWFDEPGMVWRWQLCGFGCGTIPQDLFNGGEGHMTYWFIPYWSLVIPLTLLSAYLLLSKPRPSNPMKTTQPVPEKGA